MILSCHSRYLGRPAERENEVVPQGGEEGRKSVLFGQGII